MKTNTTTIIILLAAAGLGYYLWTKRRKTAADLGAAAGSAAATAAVNTAGQILGGGTTGSTSGSGSGTTTAGKITFTETELNSLLSNGKIGNTVKALQLYLKQASQNIGAAGADGVFGADTERALNNEIGKKTVTLKELKITGVNLTTGTVFGKEVNWGSIEGAWNGVGFF
jgi:hypothetical protein